MADRRPAEALYKYLQPKAQVFLDTRNLLLGDDWDIRLLEAQKRSLITIVLISERTEQAYYQREEVASAIALTRKNPKTHRVIPVFWGGNGRFDDIPYGLRVKQGIVVGKGQSLRNAAEQLFEVLEKISSKNRGRQQRNSVRRPAPPWLSVLPVSGLRNPTGLAIDGTVLYASDHGTGEILRIETTTGRYIKRSGLAHPHHVAVMKGAILAADTDHHRILCLDPNLKEIWSRKQFGKYHLERPHGVASNHPNEFYVLSTDNNCLLLISGGAVRAVAKNPTSTRSHKRGEFAAPCGVAVNPQNVYVADTFNHRIQIFTPMLQYVTQFGEFGEERDKFAYPVSVACKREWIIISDEQNHRLQIWRVSKHKGKFTASCVYHDVGKSWVDSPFGIVFDANSYLYVADRQGGKIVRIDFELMLSTLSGKNRAR